MKARMLLPLVGLLIAGCQTPIPKDPNDPKLGAVEPEVLRRSLKGASDAFMERVGTGEINEQQFQELMALTANLLLADIGSENADPSKAWEYGEVFRTARQWSTAEQFLTTAVAYAEKTKNEDRRVNDLVRLAHVQALQDKVDDAIANVKKTFNAPDEACAPILLGTLLEVVPAAQGKGRDPELAQLLIDAAACHARTRVDANSKAGQDFLSTRTYHMRNAYRLAIRLFEDAGLTDRAIETGGLLDSLRKSSGRA